jgi:hypothetical protein
MKRTLGFSTIIALILLFFTTDTYDVQGQFATNTPSAPTATSNNADSINSPNSFLRPTHQQVLPIHQHSRQH